MCKIDTIKIVNRLKIIYLIFKQINNIPGVRKMKTKIRTTEVKLRGADTDSMASRLQLGLSNRDISTKDELLRDAKESKKTNKEMLDGFKSKISNMLQNNSYLDETANVNIFENEHTKTHLAFRFMPDAFENFISFEGIVYAINSSGKLYVYTIEMKEEGV